MLPAQFRPVRHRSHQYADMPIPLLIDIKMAAGVFSNHQTRDDTAIEWIEAPEWITPQPGIFVAQVIGESMNRRIPNGSWCLFRVNSSGTRQGKVVIAQHRSIDDPETGGKYTIKVYSSKKKPCPISDESEQGLMIPTS
uniref:S24 family peptidase n=1 Tax=Castellaniella defragrans TaxID=75697 RepID=UPI00333FB8B2